MATTVNHGQIARVDDLGNVDVFYPKTFSSDVYVNSNKRSLANFLGSTDISQIGDGTVSGAISDLNENAGGKEITQEEYEMLPEYEKTHGTYYIKNAGGASSLTVDQTLDRTSYNPIANKAVSEGFGGTTGSTYEGSTTATAAHAVGDYFMWGGKLVRTTSKISVADTISLSTNVEAGNIASTLTLLNKKKLDRRKRCVLSVAANGTVTSDFGLTLADLHSMIQTDEWQDYIQHGDWIEVTTLHTTPHVHEMHMNINTYRHYGTEDVAPHIDFISKDLIPGSVGWRIRTTDTNNGNASERSPLLSSTEAGCLLANLSAYDGYIPAAFKSYLKKKNFLAPTRYATMTLTDDNSWEWKTFPSLSFVLFEAEVFPNASWSTRGFGTGGFRQYPVFQDGSFICKLHNGGRAVWWLGDAVSGASVNFLCVYYNGYCGSAYASGTALGVPWAVRFE